MHAISRSIMQLLTCKGALGRGESVVAPFGFALVAILLTSIGLAAYWSQQTQQSVAAEGRRNQTRAAATMLQSGLESLLAAGDLSGARRLVVETATHHELLVCHAELPDGRVLADADPTRIDRFSIEDQWPAGSAPLPGERSENGAIRVILPLHVAGRGHASLEIRAATQPPELAVWRAHAGIALIATFSLSGLLVVYRMTRSRLATLGEIDQVLTSIHNGETSLAAVRLNSRLGPAAEAWNAIALENDKLQQQKVAEKARQTLGADRRSSGGLTAACDAMSHGLILTDAQMLVTYTNGAAAVFLETDRQTLVGSSLKDYLHDENLLELLQAASGASKKGRGAVEIDKRAESGDAGVLRYSIRPLGGDHGISAAVIIEDVTQQRVAEDSRHAFVAQATHELRTPLTNIRLAVETMNDSPFDRQTRTKYLDVVNQEARRLERSVGEMLSVAEIEAGAIAIEHDDLPLKDMFGQLKNDYEPQAAEKNITVTFELPPKWPAMTGDRDKIMMALHNLMGNALKYTPAGKRVTVTVEPRASELVVHVHDTGIGINEGDARRIFEKFYRAKDKRVHELTGSGLGLALAREVTRLHGGDITVESQLDEGSTFTMTLPLMNQAA